jgi:DNA-binding transcriptional MerR regulator
MKEHMVSRVFSTATAAKITGASIRMLDHWARSGLLPSSGQQANGKGSRRSYTFQDLVSIRTILDLRKGECPLQKIRAAVQELRLQSPALSNSQTLSRLTLLTDGKQVFILTDERQAMEVLTRQMVWSVPLGRRIKETAERVEKLPQVWTEAVVVAGRTFHLRISGIRNGKGFVAHCRELPGTLQRGTTSLEAVRKSRTAIKDVLTHLKRETANHRVVAAPASH